MFLNISQRQCRRQFEAGPAEHLGDVSATFEAGPPNALGDILARFKLTHRTSQRHFGDVRGRAHRTSQRHFGDVRGRPAESGLGYPRGAPTIFSARRTFWPVVAPGRKSTSTSTASCACVTHLRARPRDGLGETETVLDGECVRPWSRLRAPSARHPAAAPRPVRGRSAIGGGPGFRGGRKAGVVVLKTQARSPRQQRPPTTRSKRDTSACAIPDRRSG